MTLIEPNFVLESTNAKYICEWESSQRDKKEYRGDRSGATADAAYLLLDVAFDLVELSIVLPTTR